MMLKILIADDHAIVRQGLKQIVTETQDMIVAGEASNGQELLNKINEGDYDVVVLDITMPHKNGMDVLRELRTKWPRLPVLMLSIYPEEHYALRALKAGASGYLTKESAPEELVVAIRKISRGGKYISPSLAEKLALELEIGRDQAPHETLSDREYQVLCMIASGKTVMEIAQELTLSEKTISTYRSRILEKMQMKNNAELTYYAIKNQLVE
jgi:two-component system invasion response regulator UvrY